MLNAILLHFLYFCIMKYHLPIFHTGNWPVLLLFSAFVTSCLLSCSPKQKGSKQAFIMVSIEPLRYFTESIAGDGFQVESIVPEGYNPESYKPTPEQLMKLSECQIFFKIGQLGFETTWLEKTCQEQPSLHVVDTSDSLRTNAAGISLASFDPHTWTSPQNAIWICKTICQALCDADSSHTATYRSNLEKTIRRIEQTDQQIHQILSNLPSRTFITVHPSLTYFAQTYGLRQLSIEKEGKEPTPSDLKELIRQCREDGNPVILIQKQFARAQAEIIAKETGSKIISINPLGYNWDKEMLHIANTLHNGE